MKSAATVLCAAIATLASSAGAVEREHHLGIDAGGAMLAISDKGTPDLGAGFGAHWAYGLSDAFNLMAEGAWSLVALGEKGGPKTPRTRPSSVADIAVGLGYVFDVLTWVPYAGALIGGYALTGGTLDKTPILAGAAMALGLDYRFGRKCVAGVGFRQHFMVTETSTYPSFTQVFGRFEYTWGW